MFLLFTDRYTLIKAVKVKSGDKKRVTSVLGPSHYKLWELLSLKHANYVEIAHRIHS